MDAFLRKIETPYVDAQTLLALLSDYHKPREWIRRKVMGGELIRLKNGFYLIAERVEKEVPYEQVANLLYGPSYVSLEWALSFYGVIPERVYTVTSMTLGRAKTYTTPVGNFTYSPLKSSCYSVGIDQLPEVRFLGGFLMASLEKALADLVFLQCKGMDWKELEEDLFQSKRMNRDLLRKIDKNRMLRIAHAYSSKHIDELLRIL